MIHPQQRKQLSALIRRLADGSISSGEFERQRTEIFGHDTAFEDVEFNDKNAHDLTAIALSCEALYLCVPTKDCNIWDKWLKAKPKSGQELSERLSSICLFLCSDCELYCFDDDTNLKMPSYRHELLMFFISIAIFFSGLFATVPLVVGLLSWPYGLYYVPILMTISLAMIFALMIYISEHTQRQAKLAIDKWENDNFFKYPFVTQAQYEEARRSAHLLGNLAAGAHGATDGANQAHFN
jgi:uncharacterized membrane protein